MGAESKVQAKILEHIKKIGGYSIKVITASKAGVADIIVCYKSKFIAIEVKAPGKIHNTSELQKYNTELVRASGGISLVVDNLQDVITFFNSLDNQI